MSDGVNRWVEAAIAQLPREGRGRVLRTLRVSRCGDSSVAVERALGFTRGRLGRAEREQGGGLTKNELAALMVHYRASMLEVWLANTLALEDGGLGAGVNVRRGGRRRSSTTTASDVKRRST